MTAKEYLEQIKTADEKIKRLQREREDLRAIMYSIGSPVLDADKVQTSVTGDRMLNLIAKADRLEKDMLDEINNLIDLKRRISLDIEALPNPRYRYILHSRYVMRDSPRVIAFSMDVQNIKSYFKMHGRALKQFQRIHAKKLGRGD